MNEQCLLTPSVSLHKTFSPKFVSLQLISSPDRTCSSLSTKHSFLLHILPLSLLIFGSCSNLICRAHHVCKPPFLRTTLVTDLHTTNFTKQVVIQSPAFCVVLAQGKNFHLATYSFKVLHTHAGSSASAWCCLLLLVAHRDGGPRYDSRARGWQHSTI